MEEWRSLLAYCLKDKGTTTSTGEEGNACVLHRAEKPLEILLEDIRK